MRIIVLSALFTLLILSGLKTSAQTPVASFTANPVIGCVPHVVYFASTATGNPTSYYWTFGNGVTSTLPNPSTTYLNPGQYTVSLTVSNASGIPKATTAGLLRLGSASRNPIAMAVTIIVGMCARSDSFKNSGKYSL